MMTDDDAKEKPPLHGFAVALVAAAVLTYSTRFVSVMDPKWAAIAVFGAIAGAAAAWRNRGALYGPGPFRWLWAWLGLSLLIRLTVAQPVSWPLALVVFLKTAALLLTAEILLALTRGRREVLWAAFFWSAVVSALLALAQYAGALAAVFPPAPAYGQPMYGVFGNQAILAAFWAGALPLSAVCWPAPRPARAATLLGVAVLSCALLLSGSRGALLAAVLGMAVAAYWRTPAAKMWAVGAAIAIGAASAAAVAGTAAFVRMAAIETSLGLRRWFWDGALRMLADHALWGAGPGQFRAHSPRYLGEALWAEGGEVHTFNAVHTWHAHNDALEFAAEHGAAALIPFAMWIALLVWRGRGPLWGCLAALGAASCVNPVFAYPPHALLALAAAGHMMAGAGERPPRPGRRAALLAAAGGAVIVFAVAPSYGLRLAQDRELAGGDGLALLQGLAREPMAAPAVYEKLGIAHMHRAEYVQARDAFQRAVTTGGATGDAWLGLALCALYLGDGDGAYHAAQSCLNVWPADIDAWAVAMAAAPEAERAALAAAAAYWIAPGDWAAAEAQAAALRRFLEP